MMSDKAIVSGTAIPLMREVLDGIHFKLPNEAYEIETVAQLRDVFLQWFDLIDDNVPSPELVVFEQVSIGPEGIKVLFKQPIEL
jgi:hypothetical protein